MILIVRNAQSWPPRTGWTCHNQPEEGEKEVTKVKKTKSKKSEKDSDSAPARTTSKKRAQRSGSNVFAMFTQHQVAQFKEAFQFIDSDKDGIISKNDIRATFDALGRLCTDKELEEMASEAPVSEVKDDDE